MEYNLDREKVHPVEKKYLYQLPIYKLSDDGPVETGEFSDLKFIRGNKLDQESWKEGVLHESLLSTMIYDLKLKNEEVPSREGSLIVTKLEEALHWMRQRQIDRIVRGVVGTYQK